MIDTAFRTAADAGPNAEALARELARRGLDVGLDRLRLLAPERQRACRALLDRRAALRADAVALAAALAAAQHELDRAMRSEWLACVQGELHDRVELRRCEVNLAAVERLERELVVVRASLQGLDEDLAALLRAPAGPVRASA